MLLRTLMKAFLVVLLLSLGSVSAQELSDDEIRQLLINQSIRSYSGSCPCPYNTTKSGSRCGGRSAYSKPGGAEPLCYAKDVSDEMVERYKKQHKKKQ